MGEGCSIYGRGEKVLREFEATQGHDADELREFCGEIAVALEITTLVYGTLLAKCSRDPKPAPRAANRAITARIQMAICPQVIDIGHRRFRRTVNGRGPANAACVSGNFCA
jgi:hypothetical protein